MEIKSTKIRGAKNVYRILIQNIIKNKLQNVDV